MERLGLDEIEALRASVNAEAQLFRSADANQPTNEHHLSTTLAPSNSKRKNTSAGQNGSSWVEHTHGQQFQQKDWMSEVITQREVITNAFKSLEDAASDYNKEASKYDWERLEQLGLEVQEKNDLVQAAKVSRYPTDSGPRSFGQALKTRLGSFFLVVNGFVAVLDVVASAYPGWESLAWGAVRFLLTAGIKYQKLKEKVEVCLGQIGENFKKISSFSKIYPTEQIVQHVCGAYSEFVKFLENAVRFYKDSKLKILLKSAIGKYDFPEVEKFNKQIDGVLDGVAMLHVATNVHTNLLAIDTNREIQLLSVHVDQSRQENKSFHNQLLQENRTFQDFMLRKNGRLDIMMKDAAKSGFRALAQDVFEKIQYENSLSTLPKNTAVPKLFIGENSHIRKSMFEELDETDSDFDSCDLRRQLIPDHLTYEHMGLFRLVEIKDWVESESPGLLWMNGFIAGAYEWTVGFTVDLLRAARSYNYPTLYYFCAEHFGSGSSRYLLQPKAIIHAFIFQLIQQFQEAFKSDARLLDPSCFECARDDFGESWNIFTELLEHIHPPVMYIVVDSIDTIHPDERTYVKEDFSALVEGLQDLTMKGKQVIKILMATRYARDYPGVPAATAQTSCSRMRVVDVPPTLGSSFPRPPTLGSQDYSWTPFMNEMPDPEVKLGRMSTWEKFKEEQKQYDEEEREKMHKGELS